MTTLRLLCCAGTVAAAAAIGVASPASAEPAEGMYVATITNVVPPGIAEVGGTMNAMLASCGPGCVRFMTSSETAWFGDFTPQGASWTGPLQNAITASDGCFGTLDDAATTFVINCGPEAVTYALAKTG